MNAYLMAQGYDVWLSVKEGYTISETTLTDIAEKKKAKNNAKTTNALMSALSDTEFARPTSIKFGLDFDHRNASKQALAIKELSMAENPVKFVKEKKKSFQFKATPNKRSVSQKKSKPVDQDGFTLVGSQKFGRGRRQTQNIFHGYCFGCNSYGHRVVDCRKKTKPTMVTTNNKFASLMKEGIECYRCYKVGHLARNCNTLLPSQIRNLKTPKRSSGNKIHNSS
ncbi:uncharacterized protein LOC122668551 [Telopea speciosissima]|uniref:uncharacterized protein LOC122668551 n=1 Tax=Telopea speciosissima TaxID=54955 RepID=UPI001CC3E32A|nr:uncharacterized protein LOC122668551 [Telopea speciosissima]